MGEHRLRFYVSPQLREAGVIDLRDDPEAAVLGKAEDMAESLLAYIRRVRSGEEAASPGAARDNIATKAQAIENLVTQDHERTP